MKRVDLRGKVEPFAKKLADEMAALVGAHVDSLLDRAHAYAVERLRADLSPPAPLESAPVAIETRSPKPKPARQRTNAKPDRRAAIANATRTAEPPKDPPKGRKRMRCSKCGAEGYRSDGCGKTHNKPAQSDDEEGEGVLLHDSDVPAVRVDDVIALMTPDMSLFDRETLDHDEIAGGGAFPVLPGSGRGLVELSPTDHREVCAHHGWIGRLAFQRDRHDLCVTRLDREPCTQCRGTGLVTASFCRRCGGTGFKPQPWEPSALDDHDDVADPEGEGDVVPRVLLPGGRHQNRIRNPEVARATTLAQKRIGRVMLRDEDAALAPFVSSQEYGDLVALRPRTRGDCAGGERPCPWVSCVHHLYLEVNPESGSIKLNFPDREVDQLRETCALDVADAGAHTLEVVGELCNNTRERIRQIEVKAFFSLKAGIAALERRGDS